MCPTQMMPICTFSLLAQTDRPKSRRWRRTISRDVEPAGSFANSASDRSRSSGAFARSALAQGAPNAVRVQIGAIDGRPGLLSPGLVERSRVDAVEAELVDEGQDHGLGEGIVAGDGESDPILRSFRPAPLRQGVRSDVVEHFHHGSPFGRIRFAEY